MSPVITLRACLVAAGAALLVALTGCADTATQADPHSGMTRLDLSGALGKTPEPAPARNGLGTGVSAALDALSAPDALADAADQAARVPSAPAPAVPISAAPAAPVVQDQPAPAPGPDSTCAPGELWDPTIPACVAQQLPEEAIGGARCPEPTDVVVAIREDGSLVCGPADDTVAGA